MSLVKRGEAASELSVSAARSPIGWNMAIGGVVIIASLALLAEYSSFDRWMLDAFFDAASGRFPPQRFGISLRWLHDAQSGLVGLFAVAALWMTLVGARASSRFSAREALYLLACMALTTAAIGSIKRVSGAECPWDLQAYGGERAYTHLFTPAPGGDGRCASAARSACSAPPARAGTSAAA